MFLISLIFSFSLAGNVNDHLHVETILENAPAQNNGPCTNWIKDTSVSCAMKNGNEASLWRRDCLHSWDYKTICTNKNPNQLQMVCTDWQKNTSVECLSGSNQYFRQCQDVRYKLTYCASSSN